jgi:hypothetical protein
MDPSFFSSYTYNLRSSFFFSSCSIKTLTGFDLFACSIFSSVTMHR